MDVRVIYQLKDDLSLQRCHAERDIDRGQEFVVASGRLVMMDLEDAKGNVRYPSELDQSRGKVN